MRDRRKDIGQEAAFGKAPVRFRHFLGIGPQPQHAEGAVGLLADEPMPRRDLREAFAERRQATDEFDQILAFDSEARPVGPTGLIVLAIGVVVTALAIADLVAGEQQRHALRKQQAGELISPELTAERSNFRVVGRPFLSAILAVIVVRAVVVVLAVRRVVLLAIGVEVSKRAAV